MHVQHNGEHTAYCCMYSIMKNIMQTQCRVVHPSVRIYAESMHLLKRIFLEQSVLEFCMFQQKVLEECKKAVQWLGARVH